MSQLNIDTIQNRSGGPVTLTQANTSKAWMGNGSGSDGVGIDQSLNVSSQEDLGVGRYAYNITNAFANQVDEYGLTGSCGNGSRVWRVRNDATSTTYLSTAQDTASTAAAVDTSHFWSIVGDLA